ncbi:glycosyltransferase [soil metagenome]
MSQLRVALVATVLNEYGSLPCWIQGLALQRRLPDECVIVDGGSTDGTVEYLQSQPFPFPCRILQVPGAGIAAGRNIAIEAVTADAIVVTDAGTRAEADWLQRLIEPFESRPEVDLVAGFFKPVTGDVWTQTLAAATLPEPEDVELRTFLPSSRSVAFRKRWFEAGFRYPEWLDYCEDLVFDLQLRQANASQITRIDAVVSFQPRGSLLQFIRQYFRYARGDGKAGLFFRRHLIRYLTYALGIGVICRRRPIELLVALLCGSVYLRQSVLRFGRRHPGALRDVHRAPLILALIALQKAVGDAAKMVGYPVGLVWRLKTDRSARFWKTGWRFRRPDGHLRRL